MRRRERAPWTWSRSSSNRRLASIWRGRSLSLSHSHTISHPLSLSLPLSSLSLAITHLRIVGQSLWSEARARVRGRRARGVWCGPGVVRSCWSPGGWPGSRALFSPAQADPWRAAAEPSPSRPGPAQPSPVACALAAHSLHARTHTHSSALRAVPPCVAWPCPRLCSGSSAGRRAGRRQALSALPPPGGVSAGHAAA